MTQFTPRLGGIEDRAFIDVAGARIRGVLTELPEPVRAVPAENFVHDSFLY
jgi:hypothetical protein